jgi:hypothetical protein
MQTNKFLKKFCDRLQTVVEELCKLFPRENDFAVLETAIMGLIEFEKYDILAKEYYKFVYKYHNIIDTNDEVALLKLDYSDDIKEIKTDQSTGALKIAHFKKLVQSNVSAETKKNFFGHLQILNRIIEHIRDEEKSVAFNN